MNEHEPHQPEQQPPAEPEIRARPRDDLDARLIELALEAMRRYGETGRGYGDAFHAYETLGIDLPDDEDEEADFLKRYVGFYPDRASFVRAQLEELGWSNAVTEFKAEQGMWPEDLQWDEAVLWDHFTEQFGLVERFGGVHAFRI